MRAYFDQRKRRWMNDGRKATNAEVRQAIASAFKAGPIPCKIDGSTTIMVGPDKNVRLDMEGNAIGLSHTRYGQ